MYFASDNWAGAPLEIRAALAAACAGFAPAYGGDDSSKRLQTKLSEVFEREVAIALMPTGTAANALALAALSPPQGVIYAHQDAHIIREECGAVEFFTGGARIVGVAGEAGRLSREAFIAALAENPASGAPFPVNAALSLTEATECGTLYRPDDIAALASLAKSKNMGVHMDGARLANALAALGCSPADLTWKAGVDILSLGLTKAGAMMAEAILFFEPEKAPSIEWLRKRGGHVMSKTRLASSQFLAMLEDDLWLRLARHANLAAARLAKGIKEQGHALVWSCEANEVFVVLPNSLVMKLRGAGAIFYDWPAASLPKERRPRDDETAIRLVTSFATGEDEVEQFVGLMKI